MAEVVETQRRPDRWDHPLDPSLDARTVRWLLEQSPFSEMDGSRFSSSTKLEDILRNDSRIITLRPGDLLFREGQYGEAAYLVLSGACCIFLERLRFAGDQNVVQKWKRSSWMSFLNNAKSTILPNSSSKAGNPKQRDRRRRARRDENRYTTEPQTEVSLGYRNDGDETQVFLQDVPAVLSQHDNASVGAGTLFGELSAVTRTPREFTAVADQPTQVLEIRWQGLKLLRQDPRFRQLIDDRYRKESLRNHLREMPAFRFVPEENLTEVVKATSFEQFGELEWYAKYRNANKLSFEDRIANEPLIAEEGTYPSALWVIRSGFARLSYRQGAGHRTLAYMGKGQLFGLRELIHNYESSTKAANTSPLPYQESLRAIGYVDALSIPKRVVLEHILPFVRAADFPERIKTPRYQFGDVGEDPSTASESGQLETGLLEFMVDQRLMNGREAMVINTDLCTRCDDCVRACASTHGGVPVFERSGPNYGGLMFAQACMHCQDPVCMIGCPTGAIHRDHSSGLVHINESTCIGCKTCAESCPYDNIRMVPSRDSQGRPLVESATGLPILQASKCDLCSSASVSGPACQLACPHDALVRIDLSKSSELERHVKRKGS